MVHLSQEETAPSAEQVLEARDRRDRVVPSGLYSCSPSHRRVKPVMRAALLVARALAAVAMVVGLVAGVRAIRDRSPTVVDNVEKVLQGTFGGYAPARPTSPSNPFRVDDRAVRRAAAPIASASVAEPGEDAAEETRASPSARMAAERDCSRAHRHRVARRGPGRFTGSPSPGSAIRSARSAWPRIGPDFIRVVQDDLSWTFEFSEFSSANGRQ